MAARVKAVLLLSSDLSKFRLDVKAAAGAVAVSGSIPNWVTEEELIDKIRRVAGVKEVKFDIANVPVLGAVEWP